MPQKVYITILMDTVIFLPPSIMQMDLKGKLDEINWSTIAWTRASFASLSVMILSGWSSLKEVHVLVPSW
jgi:hypothetical protein